MMQKEYVPLSAMYGRQFCNLLDSATADKRFIVSLMADAFINGMTAQERLDKEKDSNTSGSPPPPTAGPPPGFGLAGGVLGSGTGGGAKMNAPENINLTADHAAKIYAKLPPEKQRIADRLIDLLLKDAAFSSVFQKMMESGNVLSGPELSDFMDRWTAEQTNLSPDELKGGAVI